MPRCGYGGFLINFQLAALPRSSGQGGVSWDETGEVGSLDAGGGLEFLLAKLPWSADLLGPPRNIGSGSGYFLVTRLKKSLYRT